MPRALHPNEIPVDLPLVRGLLGRAQPAHASLPLRPLGASGSSNALFRLGEDLLVRLPRQPGGSEAIEKEARWLGWIAPQLPVAVPEILFVGEPDLGYPERWSVVRWLDGELVTPPGDPARDGPDRSALAQDLAGLVTELRLVDVPEQGLRDPALHSYRGEPIAALDEQTRERIEECRSIPGLDLDLDAALAVWDQAMALPGAGTVAEGSWLHGDLLAENLLVDGGRLAGVLDFGGLAVGDPTVDLVVAWEVLDGPARETFRQGVDVGDESWLLGRAWALAIAMMTFPYYWHTMPTRCDHRLVMAHAVLADATGEGPG